MANGYVVLRDATGGPNRLAALPPGMARVVMGRRVIPMPLGAVVPSSAVSTGCVPPDFAFSNVYGSPKMYNARPHRCQAPQGAVEGGGLETMQDFTPVSENEMWETDLQPLGPNRDAEAAEYGGLSEKGERQRGMLRPNVNPREPRGQVAGAVTVRACRQPRATDSMVGSSSLPPPPTSYARAPSPPSHISLALRRPRRSQGQICYGFLSCTT
jgi:hypothetical protein